jgi:Ser/Thr protein kinase RdoA (MazF antagonist)
MMDRGDNAPFAMSPGGEEQSEVELSGGRLTPGVVRIGETVRRPHKAASYFVASLLAHLAAEGCEWAPRYLGRDSQGRDVLSYMHGEVPAKWRHFTDEQLIAAARIVRSLHDRTCHSPLRAANSVVCHNDLGPNNFVFRDSIPCALIDFDLAAPGEPVDDLGYMAWAWCISSKPSRGPVTAQAQQVVVLANAYGLTHAERVRLPDAIVERQRRNTEFWLEQLARQPDNTNSTPGKVVEVIEWSKREMHYTQAHHSDFLAAILR